MAQLVVAQLGPLGFGLIGLPAPWAIGLTQDQALKIVFLFKSYLIFFTYVLNMIHE